MCQTNAGQYMYGRWSHGIYICLFEKLASNFFKIAYYFEPYTFKLIFSAFVFVILSFRIACWVGRLKHASTPPRQTWQIHRKVTVSRSKAKMEIWSRAQHSCRANSLNSPRPRVTTQTQFILGRWAAKELIWWDTENWFNVGCCVVSYRNKTF